MDSSILTKIQAYKQRIRFRELAIALGVIFQGTQEEKLRCIFSLYDKDGDGFVTKDEMKLILTSSVQISKPTMCYTEVSAIVEMNIEKIFDELDQNHDGMLSLDEFCQVGNTSFIFMEVFQHGVSKFFN